MHIRSSPFCPCSSLRLEAPASFLYCAAEWNAYSWLLVMEKAARLRRWPPSPRCADLPPKPRRCKRAQQRRHDVTRSREGCVTYILGRGETEWNQHLKQSATEASEHRVLGQQPREHSPFKEIQSLCHNPQQQEESPVSQEFTYTTENKRTVMYILVEMSLSLEKHWKKPRN